MSASTTPPCSTVTPSFARACRGPCPGRRRPRRRDLALDRDACADDRARHVLVSLTRFPSDAGSSKSASMRPANCAPSSMLISEPFKSPRTRAVRRGERARSRSRRPSASPAIVTACASRLSRLDVRALADRRDRRERRCRPRPCRGSGGRPRRKSSAANADARAEHARVTRADERGNVSCGAGLRLSHERHHVYVSSLRLARRGARP